MGPREAPRRTKSGLNRFAYTQWRAILKYFVVIEGIDPAPERPLVGHSATREGAEGVGHCPPEVPGGHAEVCEC